MKTIGIGILFAVMATVTHAEDEADECLKTAIRASVNLPHAPTDNCEAVMVEGMWIAFTNSHGDMKITAGKGFERNYT